MVSVIFHSILILCVFSQISESSPLHHKNPTKIQNENQAVAEKYGIYLERLELCKLPDFFESNSDFYDPTTNVLNLKDAVKFWRILHNQMKLRYGREELEKALNGLDSNVKFDELDDIYFSIRSFFLCLKASNVSD